MEMVRDCLHTGFCVVVNKLTEQNYILLTQSFDHCQRCLLPFSPHFFLLTSTQQQRKHIFSLPLIDTVEPREPSAWFQHLKCMQSTTASIMPPPGRPQVIYNQTTSLTLKENTHCTWMWTLQGLSSCSAGRGQDLTPIQDWNLSPIIIREWNHVIIM